MDADLTANAERVLEARYLLRDGLGRVTESPGQLFERVAGAVAAAEARVAGGDEAGWRQRFHDAMASLDFLPKLPQPWLANTVPTVARTTKTASMGMNARFMNGASQSAPGISPEDR